MKDAKRKSAAGSLSLAAHATFLIVAVAVSPRGSPPEAPPPVRRFVMPLALPPRAAKEPKPQAEAPTLVPKLEIGAFDRASTQPRAAPGSGAAGQVIVGDLNTGIAASGSGQAAGTVVTDLFGGGVGTATRVGAAAERQAADEAARLLEAPEPFYTEEARRLNVTGEVVLQVKLRASGIAIVLRVMRGLGHGLDEAAIEAISRLRFEPARRAGNPVDVIAQISVVFRLA